MDSIFKMYLNMTQIRKTLFLFLKIRNYCHQISATVQYKTSPLLFHMESKLASRIELTREEILGGNWQ